MSTALRASSLRCIQLVARMERERNPGLLCCVRETRIALRSIRATLANPPGLTSASENEALLREAVMKKPEWHDVLEPREAVIAGIVGLAVVTRLTTPAVAGSDG